MKNNKKTDANAINDNTGKNSEAVTKKKPVHHHQGHRGRLRKRYEVGKFDILQPHEVVEYLLYFSYTQIDVNILAHKITAEYGNSLYNILSADIEIMAKKVGLSKTAETNFKFIHDVIKNYFMQKNAGASKGFADIRHIEEYLMAYYWGVKNEQIILLTLDNSWKLISRTLIHEGGVKYAINSMNKITETIFRDKAATVVLAHNHPSGNDSPSSDDIYVTQTISNTLNLLEIGFIDHYIVTEDKVVGLKAFC